MIAIEYTGVPGYHHLEIKGHAGYSEQGGDIVCAGVSAITYTLLGFLNNREDDIWHLRAHTESGNAAVTCTGDHHIDTAFEMAVIGYAQIANQYPDNVTLHISAPGGDSREQTAGKEHGNHA